MDFSELLHVVVKIDTWISLSKLLHGCDKIDTWISLSCYMDLFNLLHGFVKVAN